MHSILSTFPKNLQSIYYSTFPVSGNICGRTAVLLDQISPQTMPMAQGTLAGNAKRIVSIALLIFGLVALCWFAINCVLEIARVSKKVVTPATPATLETEFSSAKQELLIDRRMLGHGDLRNKTSAKIFLAIEHDNQTLTETLVIPKIDQQLSDKQIEEQFIAQIDVLFDKMRTSIKFNDHDKTTNFKILVLLKHSVTHRGQPIFSKVLAETTVHGGKTSGIQFSSSSGFRLNYDLQEAYCDSMNLPFTPQIDAQGDFV
jgi:hypothetical protein